MNTAAVRQLVQSTVESISLAAPDKAIVPPCPNCSYVDMYPTGRDKLIAPRIAQGRRRGLWYVLPCCKLSDGIPPQLTREDALKIWEGARSDLGRLPNVAQPKARHTEQQLSHAQKQLAEMG